MNAEFYRYNQVFEYSINYPIELYREMRFERDVPFIRLSVFDEKILVAAQKDLTLLDFDSGELQWERKTESYIGSPVCIDKDHIYTTVDDAPGCLDANTGEIIWRIDRKELAIGSSEKYLYCTYDEDGKDEILCRSKEGGALLWAFDKLFDFASTIASESGIVIIHGGEGFHSVNEDSGELLWEFTFEEFNKKYDTGAAPGRRGIRGPLINGIFYFTMAKDLLVAVDASNGELIWQYSLNMPFKAKAMIFKEGRLYFTVDHGFCSDNPLFCIDAETGEEIFKTEEYFTPKGCHNSVITDNYLIGGDGKYLSFFDLEKQEFIYRFKERKKRPIFGGVLYPYKNQLVTCSDKTLFWFKSKK